MKKVEKTVVYRIFQKKYSTYRQKRSSEVLNTNYTGYIKIQVYFKIKPERRQIFRFDLGLPVSLMCLGVYACKKNLTHVLRKMKASSTNWLI